MRGLFAGGLILGVVAAGGCSSTQSKEVQIPEGQYPQAFEAARESLREMRFRLDRVDAASGVIATSAKSSAGLATPWDGEQSGIDQEWEDFINHQRRTVRITFEPAQIAGEPPARREPGSAKSVPLVDLRDVTGPVLATVDVTIERIQRPGWQVNTKSVNQSTFTRDPVLSSKGMFPTYSVELEPDDRLAGRIAESIRRKLEGQ